MPQICEKRVKNRFGPPKSLSLAAFLAQEQVKLLLLLAQARVSYQRSLFSQSKRDEAEASFLDQCVLSYKYRPGTRNCNVASTM